MMNNITDAACRIFSMATSGNDISKSEILMHAQDCRIREINHLIRDLDRHYKDLKQQSYRVYDVVRALTDEIRRRAEEQEAQHG